MKNSELLNIQTNAKETDKQSSGENDKIIEHEMLENTPFRLVNEKEKGWYIVLGDYRLTEPVKTRKEAIKPIEEKEWKFLTTVMATIAELNERYNKLENQLDQIDQFKQTNNN